MRSEDVLDLLDSIEDTGRRTGRIPLPELSAEDIAALKLRGNPVAKIAGDTTDKSYLTLHRHKNVISNSILSSLHACPRRFVLEKMQANSIETQARGELPNIDFVFGHSVGAGIQTMLAFDMSLEYGLYAALISWDGAWELSQAKAQNN
jgi:hypothetical protein